MILVDSNIPMYLIGAEHPNKEATRRLLEAAVSRSDRLVTDAEVLQEILHRYIAIDRFTAIQPAFDALTPTSTWGPMRPKVEVGVTVVRLRRRRRRFRR